MRKTNFNWLLTLFAVIGFAFTSNAQVQIGTETNTGSIPINPYFGYSYSQSIYTASEINASGDITELSFQFNGNSTISSSTDWVVYIGHTTKTEFSSTTDWIPVSSMTEVFNGQITVNGSGSDEWITIDIADFTYNGTDNIVVAVNETTSGYDGSSDDFYSSSVSGNRSIYETHDSSPANDPSAPPTADGTLASVSNIIFGGIVQTCPLPTAQNVTDILTNSATLSWTKGDAETAWNVEYGVTGFTQGTGTTVAATDTFTNVTGLTAATAYDFYVQADCGGGDVSSWVGPYSFATLCDAVSVFPWTEDFESVTTPDLPVCWGMIDGNNDGDYWETSSAYGVGDSQAAQLHTDYNSGANDDYLILPKFTLTGNEQLKYFVRSRSTSEPNDYRVVLSTTGNAAADFTTELLALTTVNSATMEEVLPIDLSAYSGDVYIAIHVPNGGLDGYYLYFDNFTVEEIPSCIEPTAQNVTDILTNSATLSWTKGDAETAWNVEYGVTGFTQGTGTTVAATDTFTNVTGLTAATAYDFYVQADCGGGDASTWVGPYSFTTACDVVSSFPYTEDFESTSTPICWNETRTPSSSYGWISNTTDGYDGNCFRFDSYMNSSGNISLLNSGIFDFSGETALELKFWWKNPTGGNFKVVLSTDGGATYPVTLADNLTGVSTYEQKIIDLTPYCGAGNTNIVIGFEGTSNYGSGDAYIYLDKLSIATPPSCPVPTAQNVTDILANSATLSWTTGDVETAWNVEYGETGFTQGGGTTVAATDTFTNVTGLTAATNYDFYVQADCGGSTSTWVGPYSFTTACDVVTAFPWTETFENNNTDLPVCFSNPDGLWEMSTESFNGNYAARITYDHTGDANLVSPNFTLPANSFISFMWKDDDVTVAAKVAGHDTTFFEISTDNGANWIALDTLSAPSSQSAYEMAEHDLSAYTGTFKFRFRDVSDGSFSAYGTGVDSIVIKVVTCYKPTALNVQNLDATSADLAWTTGGSSTWNVMFGVAGFDTTGLGPLAADITTNPLTVDTLTPETSYEFYVRDRCAVDDSSEWVGPFQFTTTASCPNPTDLSATNITTTSADLGWNGYAATNWDILFGEAGFDTTGMPLSANDITDNPLNVDTLTANTSYEFYVRADCGQNNIDTSNWVGPFTFTTACDIISAYPYFEGYEDTELSNCWTVSDIDADGSEWVADANESFEGTQSISVDFNSSGNNDWLISPQFDITQDNLSLIFQAMSRSTSFLEDYNVLVSTTGTDPADFTTVLDNVTSAPAVWTQKTYNLTDNGINIGDHIYIAIQCVSVDEWTLYVDAFEVRELTTDLALVMPGNEDYSDCSFTGQDTIPFFVENVGNTVIATGDTIFGWYELDGATAVADTFILATDLNPTDTMFAMFAQEANLAGLTTHTFKEYFEYEPGTDMNQVNDTTEGTVTHYELSIDLGGTNDTLQVASYPHTLDAGAGFDSYLWNDLTTNQTLDVNADGWYNVLVSDTNGCDAVDTVYVVLATEINTIENTSLSIYPNPNNGEFTLNATFNTNVDFTIEMVNIDGKTIYSKEFNGVNAINENIDVDVFAKGIYYIRIVNENFVKQEKVVIY